MIYKGYYIFPEKGHLMIVDANGHFVANVDTYSEAREEIDNDCI